MATTTDVQKTDEAPRHKPHEQLPSISGPRLPYHPAIEERFGIDKASWKALVEAIFPNATSVESVILALSYCRARKLDPFKRNVHIVPIWNKDLRTYIDTIWPGIGELRTTAFRTGEYAGRGETEFGPDITQKVGRIEITFPEWAKVSVYRMVQGQRVEFSGPRVHWLETYAVSRHDDPTPNSMWAGRPRGQVDKCAEAAALRTAFPEELGSEMIPEEVQHQKIDRNGALEEPAQQGSALDQLTERLEGPKAETSGIDTAGGEIPNDAEPETEPARSKPVDQSAGNLQGAVDLFAACTTLTDVNKAQESIAKLSLTENEQHRLVEMADAARDRIRAARGGKKGDGKLFEAGESATEAGH